MNKETLRVVVTHHFLVHYRFPIYNLLCRQAHPLPEYSFVAGTRANIPIKTIEVSAAQRAPGEGGLKWSRVRNFWFFRIFLWQTGLVKLALDRQVDAVIYLGVMYHLSTWVSIVIAKLTGKRVLMWSHGFLREERGLKGWLRERFYRLSDGFLLYGRRPRELMIRRGFDPATLYLVYNSLDYDLQRSVRDALPAGSQRCRSLFPRPELPVVVYIGRLTASKGIDQLLTAAALLKARGAGVNVLILGDGPQTAALKDSAARLSLEGRTHFYGACYEEAEIGALIGACDICVAPGEVGLTCMHSLVYGTPVITHDNPECQMPEWEAIVPGLTGDLFRHGDVEDLSRVIENWLSRHPSRDEVRKACQSVIDEYYNPHYQLKVINDAVLGRPAEGPPASPTG
jgi:glycosyltransferase involved in cell wall biosynthesis